jgi:8-oxo-dGTP pyrophosphatase MutT (NUDIX family)
MKYEKSVGGIVCTKNKEYLILKYGMGHWGLVKGNIEKGESKKETLFRELEEETGIKDAEIIDGFEEEIEYFYTLKGKKIHKKVVYFLVKTYTKIVKLSYEHDDYKWLSFQKAMRKIKFQNLKKVIEKANKFLEKREN